ncbi:MAG: ABC transporter ATP-binding protein [Armatimonadota bacterium]|nr:ABC transporter ATP-binding protein [Armatimonadota bacterium]MDR7447750.1 ABC transporter ATP-binding protein [Armatimonadota bacterium]MDR7479916.1 ABC transporter ATP-binding protein [Armatimonadota bacterium]MDR7487736.1 ABC transporter ATP-binding protein [Armatimonadota bacterium]MDR7490430.1 ABC transporter ATP-binding protein [Armatimonadota bacterium]
MSLLALDEVTKAFGGLVAVSDLSFEVREGEVLALIGPNGAGKSTAFNLISGLLAPDRGRIAFDGREITRLPPSARAHLGIGRTFQVMQPFHDMTVLENVMVGELFGHAVPKSLAEARRDAEGICRLVGIEHLMHREATGLGVADLKRLEVARALATHPRLLLLDEVMAGLRPPEVDQAVQMLRGLRSAGITLLVIDHVIRSVRDLADRVVVLNFGRKIAEGTFAAVARDPPVIQAYLGEAGEGGG